MHGSEAGPFIMGENSRGSHQPAQWDLSPSHDRVGGGLDVMPGISLFCFGLEVNEGSRSHSEATAGCLIIHFVPTLSSTFDCSQRAEFEGVMPFSPHILKGHLHLLQVRDVAVGPSSRGDTAVRCRAAPGTGYGWPSGGRRMGKWADRRTLPSAGSLVPLPSQETGAAAELDEELPFAEPIRLHHLTESLIGIAACVVGDAGGPQLREAGFTSAAVPTGALAAQAVLVTPSTHFVG